MKTVLCFGEALIDFLNINQHQAGPLTLQDYRQFPGGAPANAAVAVARLGGKALFAGQVGQDAFGDFLADSLRSYGVDTRYLLRHPSAPTALAFVMLDRHGDRSFSFYRHDSADLLLTPQQIKPSWFAPASVFHFCSNTLTTPAMADTTQNALILAKHQGAIVSFDVNLRHNLWLQQKADIALINTLVLQADVLKFSKDELDYLSQQAPTPYLAKCLAAGVRLIVITDGAGAIDYITPMHTGRVKPPKVEVIDTTAGGDAFIGGLLFELSQVSDLNSIINDNTALSQMVQFASCCGALTVTRQGAFTALPTHGQVLNLQAELNIHANA